MTEYVQAATAGQLEEARTLFMEYAASLGCSPCLRNIEREIGHLPGEYALPRGRLLLALHEVLLPRRSFRKRAPRAISA